MAIHVSKRRKLIKKKKTMKHKKSLKKTNKRRTQKGRGSIKTESGGTTFKTLIKDAFKTIAVENGWSDYDDAANEYLNFLKNMPETGETAINDYMSMFKESTPVNYGGGFEFGKYLNVVLTTVVGKFDTPCNKILSNLAFVLYCIMISTFLKAYNKHGNLEGAVNDEEFTHSLADPIKYVLYYNFKFLYNIQDQIFSTFRTCVQRVLETLQIPADSTASFIVIAIRSTLYNPQLYKTFIVKPIACILKPVITSCEEHCV